MKGSSGYLCLGYVHPIRPTMCIRHILTGFFLVICVVGRAQNPDLSRLDSLFSRIESHQKGMGSVSIFSNGKEVYQRSFGSSNVETATRSNATTTYRIGSITKTFSTVLVLQLFEDGKLSLEQKLADFYPQIPNADEITIEHLLRHRSGLFNFTNDPAYLTWMESPKTEDELLEIFAKQEAVFLPGERFEYSNTNFVLLSFIIQKITGKPYAQVLQERITNPLQLTHTYIGGKIGSKPNEAQSYTMAANWVRATETDMSIPAGAGAIVSTPTDLNLFYDALFRGDLISRESLEQMTTLNEGFGMGLFRIPFYERIALGHNGGIDGFQSTAAYFQDEKVGVAYLSNGVVMPVNDILIGVLSIYFGKDYDLPTFAAAMQLKSEDLDQYLGVYASTSIPIKITISKNGNQLLGQGTGQPAFPLEAYELHKFRFDQAGIKMDFIPEENKFILRQGGGKLEFMKEDQ